MLFTSVLLNLTEIQHCFLCLIFHTTPVCRDTFILRLGSLEPTAYIYSRYEFQDLLCSDANRNGRIIVKLLILLKELNTDIGVNVELITSHGMQVQNNFLEGFLLDVPLLGWDKKLPCRWRGSMLYWLQVPRWAASSWPTSAVKNNCLLNIRVSCSIFKYIENSSPSICTTFLQFLNSATTTKNCC